MSRFDIHRPLWLRVTSPTRLLPAKKNFIFSPTRGSSVPHEQIPRYRYNLVPIHLATSTTILFAAGCFHSVLPKDIALSRLAPMSIRLHFQCHPVLLASCLSILLDLDRVRVTISLSSRSAEDFSKLGASLTRGGNCLGIDQQKQPQRPPKDLADERKKRSVGIQARTGHRLPTLPVWTGYGSH